MQTQPSEMIARVAQALTDEFSFDPAAARLVARAAIAAMREPTEAMIASSRRATAGAKSEDTWDDVWRQMWRSMTDAALAKDSGA